MRSVGACDFDSASGDVLDGVASLEEIVADCVGAGEVAGFFGGCAIVDEGYDGVVGGCAGHEDDVAGGLALESRAIENCENCIKGVHEFGVGLAWGSGCADPLVDGGDCFGGVEIAVERGGEGLAGVVACGGVCGGVGSGGAGLIAETAPALDDAVGVAEALHREVCVGAVVGFDEFEAEGCGFDALGEEVACGEEVALAFGHLFAFDEEESWVEPESAEAMASDDGA